MNIKLCVLASEDKNRFQFVRIAELFWGHWIAAANGEYLNGFISTE